MDIYFALQSDSDGSPLIGEAANTTCYISKDGGNFTATTNAVQEIGQGAYKVPLTTTEAEFSTLLLNPVCTGAQTNIYQIDAPVTIPSVNDIWGRQAGDTTSRTITNTIPSASDNATAVWSAQTKEITGTVTISSEQAETLATASILSDVATHIATLATAEALSGVSTSIATLQTQLTSVLSGIYHWEVENDVLTIYNDNNTAIATYALTKNNEGNIIAVTPTTENA